MIRRAALDDLERSLAAVLRLWTDRVTTSDLATRCGYDLPPASWALLEHLDTHGSLRVSDIAACHGIDISSVTPRLKRLENAGLVARGRAPNDARAFLITITPEGSRALESVHAARRDLLQDALEDVDTNRLVDTAKILAHLAHRSDRRPAASSVR